MARTITISNVNLGTLQLPTPGTIARAVSRIVSITIANAMGGSTLSISDDEGASVLQVVPPVPAEVAAGGSTVVQTRVAAAGLHTITVTPEGGEGITVTISGYVAANQLPHALSIGLGIGI